MIADQGDGRFAALDALLTVERNAGVRVFAGQEAGSAAAAVRSGAQASRRGERSAVVLAAEELAGASQAIAEAARERSPLIVHVCTDPDGGGLDALAGALELGAGAVASWSAVDAPLVALAARRAAEDSETPFLHVLDFALGDAAPALPPGLPTQFLGPAKKPADAAVDAASRKRGERAYAARVPFALAGALRAVGDLAGRPLAPIERFQIADAEDVIVAFGRAFPAARAVATALRDQGRRAGVLGVRALRPFYAADVVKALARAKAIGVLEPLDVALAPCGPVAAALKGAFADAITWAPGFPGVGHIPPIVSAGFATFADATAATSGAERLFAEVEARDRATRTLVFGSDA